MNRVPSATSEVATTAMSEPNRAALIQNAKQVKALLDKTRNKLKQFTVKDGTGIVIGEVLDLRVGTDRRLHLLISPANAEANSEKGDRFLVLSSRYVQKVEMATHTLFTYLNAIEVKQLPHVHRETLFQQNSTAKSSNQVSTNTHSTNTNATINTTMTPPSDSSQLEPMGNDVFLATAEARSLAGDATVASEEMEHRVIEHRIPLLEERLVVNPRRRKLGEVIIRKEIETEMVQVPVRREKLIVEQISPDQRSLATVDLADGLDSDRYGLELRTSAQESVTATFASPRVASRILADFAEAIAKHQHQSCQQVRLEMMLDSPELANLFQSVVERHLEAQKLFE